MGKEVIYDVEVMGIEGNDMYDLVVIAKSIREAYMKAMKKLDKNDDRIIGIYERM